MVHVDALAFISNSIIIFCSNVVRPRDGNAPCGWPRKLAVRLRQGSGSMVGMPVADVVVVHVLVDMRRNKLGGTKPRLPRCSKRSRNKNRTVDQLIVLTCLSMSPNRNSPNLT